MVWVYIALSIPVLFLVLLRLLRFRFSLAVATPPGLAASASVSFLWLRREFSFDALRDFTAFRQREETGEAGRAAPDARPDPSPSGSSEQGSLGGNPSADSGPGSDRPGPGQSGALRLPDSWLAYFSALRSRFLQAGIKWLLDLAVWRILFRFGLKSGRRALGLLHPILESIHLGMEDIYALGRIAAGWSVLRGVVPALDCPVEFGFNERPFRFHVKASGGFTGLDALGFGILMALRFPWLPLGKRFVHCWKDPGLNRWQRRVLLP